jgi:hypothetical protein
MHCAIANRSAIEANTVVDHAQRDRTAPVDQLHSNVPRPSVTHDIGHGFLGDPYEMLLDGWIDGTDRALHRGF